MVVESEKLTEILAKRTLGMTLCYDCKHFTGYNHEKLGLCCKCKIKKTHCFRDMASCCEKWVDRSL